MAFKVHFVWGSHTSNEVWVVLYVQEKQLWHSFLSHDQQCCRHPCLCCCHRVAKQKLLTKNYFFTLKLWWEKSSQLSIVVFILIECCSGIISRYMTPWGRNKYEAAPCDSAAAKKANFCSGALIWHPKKIFFLQRIMSVGEWRGREFDQEPLSNRIASQQSCNEKWLDHGCKMTELLLTHSYLVMELG